ncbi:MAG: SUMF1/EgtB/PvdO family nonheme iron enzyme, partial [Bacteroidota bacterium]
VNWKQASDYAIWRTEMVNRNLAATSGDKKYREMAESGQEIPIESGVVLPGYMLPTEAQWEYAAKGMIGTQYLDEMQDYARIYPWDGHSLRNPYGREMGKFLANFKRGRGDYAGIAGKLNDGAMITEWIYAYPPNDFGLYNMAGNVNEWVNDVYRPLSFEDMDDLNSYRRDDFIDGDKTDITYDKLEGWETLIDNHTRIYKGGSWKDVSYWMSPGTRRYMEEDSATATVGFRCAMIQVATNK